MKKIIKLFLTLLIPLSVYAADGTDITGYTNVDSGTLYIDEANDRVGVKTTTPDTILQVVGDTKLGDDNTNYTEFSTTGDQAFVGSAGLPYGEIYAYDTNATITIGGIGIVNKAQITLFAVNGLSNNMTNDHTNDHITIVKAGIYKVNISVSAESTGGTIYKLGIGLFKNDGTVQFTNVHVHRNLSGGGGDVGSLNMTGLIDVSASDTIEVWLWNETNTNNVVIDDINLNLIQIGG